MHLTEIFVVSVIAEYSRCGMNICFSGKESHCFGYSLLNMFAPSCLFSAVASFLLNYKNQFWRQSNYFSQVILARSFHDKYDVHCLPYCLPCCQNSVRFCVFIFCVDKNVSWRFRLQSQGRFDANDGSQ